MPSGRTSRMKRSKSRRRTTRRRTGRRSQNGGDHSYLDVPRKFPPLPPLEPRGEQTSPRKTRFALPKEHSQSPKYDEEITSYVREAHKHHQRPMYPTRESHYTPWEKFKYSFVKDERRWPPRPNQPYRMKKKYRKVSPID